MNVNFANSEHGTLCLPCETLSSFCVKFSFETAFQALLGKSLSFTFLEIKRICSTIIGVFLSAILYLLLLVCRLL